MSTTVTSTARAPLPHREVWPAIVRSVVATARMLRRRQLHQPRGNVGRVVTFADGSHARIYRETSVGVVTRKPCVLMVSFRLRRVRGRGHRAFELESELNTPLFAGFPGFRSKLWLAHDEEGRYRGIYEWDGEAAAERYARSLWRVLALVSERGSIDYRVLPGVQRHEHLAAPDVRASGAHGSWWRVVEA